MESRQTNGKTIVNKNDSGVHFRTTLYRFCLVLRFFLWRCSLNLVHAMHSNWTANALIVCGFDSWNREKTMKSSSKLNATLWKFVTSCYFVGLTGTRYKTVTWTPFDFPTRWKPLHFASDVCVMAHYLLTQWDAPFSAGCSAFVIQINQTRFCLCFQPV